MVFKYRVNNIHDEARLDELLNTGFKVAHATPVTNNGTAYIIYILE